jgi:hypothetical protein
LLLERDLSHNKYRDINLETRVHPRKD